MNPGTVRAAAAAPSNRGVSPLTLARVYSCQGCVRPYTASPTFVKAWRSRLAASTIRPGVALRFFHAMSAACWPKPSRPSARDMA
jgi:hypothetical protein